MQPNSFEEICESMDVVAPMCVEEGDKLKRRALECLVSSMTHMLFSDSAATAKAIIRDAESKPGSILNTIWGAATEQCDCQRGRRP